MAPVKKEPDFVAQVAALACEIAGADPARVPRLERELRRRFGSTCVWIPSQPPEPAVSLERVNAGLRAGRTVREIAGETGVSRSTIYRLLGRRKSQRPGR